MIISLYNNFSYRASFYKSCIPVQFLLCECPANLGHGASAVFCRFDDNQERRVMVLSPPDPLSSFILQGWMRKVFIFSGSGKLFADEIEFLLCFPMYISVCIPQSAWTFLKNFNLHELDRKNMITWITCKIIKTLKHFPTVYL